MTAATGGDSLGGTWLLLVSWEGRVLGAKLLGLVSLGGDEVQLDGGGAGAVLRAFFFFPQGMHTGV